MLNVYPGWSLRSKDRSKETFHSERVLSVCSTVFLQPMRCEEKKEMHTQSILDGWPFAFCSLIGICLEGCCHAWIGKVS